MEYIITSKKKKQAPRIAAMYAVVTWLILFLSAGNVFAQSNSVADSSHKNLAASNLSEFTGGYSSGFVELKWTATNDADISHFEVERSTDGTNFRQIGKVLVKADDGAKNNYTYLDILAEKGSNFYRLVLIDKDGNISYSKPATIGVEKGFSLFVVYPNPFGKRVMVKFNSDYDDKVLMTIIDNTGKVVRSQTNPVTKGENLVTIQNADNLPGGIYYLEVVTKDKKMRTKLMKQATD